MRVMLVTSQFAPELGGVPRLLWQFCAHHPPGVELRVMSVRQQPRDFYQTFDAAAAMSIDRVRPLRAAGLTSLWMAARLLRGLAQWRPDVILCGVAYPTAIIVRAVTRLLPMPYVVYAHSEDVTVLGARKRAALSAALRRAAAVPTASQFTRAALRALGVDETRALVAPPGIELGRQPGTQPQLLEALRDRWMLLTVARLVMRKGQDTVIRALPAIAAQLPGAHYVMVGAGPDEAYLRGLAESAGVSDRVTFAGAVSDDELPAYYRACQAFVMPTRLSDDGSEVEGFGLAYLEAAAAGKPAIASPSGGAGEAVLDGETGLLVPARDFNELARAVLRLAHEPGLARRLGEAGRRRVEHDYTPNAFAARLSHILAQAAGHRTPRA